MTLLYILFSCYLLFLHKGLVICNQELLSWFEAQEICRLRNETLFEGVPGLAKRTGNVWIGKYRRLSLWIKIAGCYTEDSVKASSATSYKMQIGSAGFCQEICLSSNMTAFALKGEECRCLKQLLPIENKVSPLKCNAVCYEDNERIEKPYFDECGGYGTYTVFLSGTDDERAVFSNVTGSLCVAIYCSAHSNSTFFFKEDCNISHFKPACSINTRILGSWMESMRLCKTNISSTYITGKVYLGDIEKTCTRTGQKLTDIRWLGVAKESYNGIDRGTKISGEDKRLLIQCMKCNDDGCDFSSCDKAVKGTVLCTKKKQEKNVETTDKSHMSSLVTSIDSHSKTTTVTIPDNSVSDVISAQITSANKSATNGVTYAKTNQVPTILPKTTLEKTPSKILTITSITGNNTEAQSSILPTVRIPILTANPTVETREGTTARTEATDAASKTISDESAAKAVSMQIITKLEGGPTVSTSTTKLKSTIGKATTESKATTVSPTKDTKATAAQLTTASKTITFNSTREAKTTAKSATAIISRSTTEETTRRSKPTAEATAITTKSTSKTLATAANSTREAKTPTLTSTSEEKPTVKPEIETTSIIATPITERKTRAVNSTGGAAATTTKSTNEIKATAATSTAKNTITDELAVKEETTVKSATTTAALITKSTTETITATKHYDTDSTKKDDVFEIGIPIVIAVTIGGIISALLLICLCKKIKQNKMRGIQSNQDQRDLGYFEFDSNITGIINHNYFLLERQEQIIKSKNSSKEIESPRYDIDERKSDHPRDREVKLMYNNKEHPYAAVTKSIPISENPFMKNNGGIKDRLGGKDSDQGQSDAKRTSINNHDYFILEPWGQSSKSENVSNEMESPSYDIDREKYDNARTREERIRNTNMENSYATVNKTISKSKNTLLENKGVNDRLGGMDSDQQSDSKRSSIENHTYFILKPQGESNKSENTSKKNESPVSETKEGVYDHLRDRELNTGNADTENNYDTVSKGISISEYQSLENEEETYDRLGDKKFTNEDDVDDTYHHAVTFRTGNRDYDTIDRFKSHGLDSTYNHISQ